MALDIGLRAVSIEDAEQLLLWRNDETTRLASHQTQVLSLSEHQSWLAKSLCNPQRKLYIAQYLGQDIGTVRADYLIERQAWLLSWTLAPEKRGQGLAKHMVHAFVDVIDDDICAEIKDSNLASIKIALFIGCTLIDTKKTIQFYFKKRIASKIPAKR